MDEELLWEILENHYYRLKGGYERKAVYIIPWDSCAWLLEFFIGKKFFRAIIENHAKGHIYVLGIVTMNSVDELNVPETWFTDWDGPVRKKEFCKKHKEKLTSNGYEEETKHDQDDIE